MARTGQDTGNGQASGLDLLRDELASFVGAQMGNLADKAGDKVAGLTDQLVGVAENGGVLPKAGLKILQGESPLKALGGGVLDKAKQALGGGKKGKGRKSGTQKVTNIVEVQDVGVPIRFAYDHWTQFEKFSAFTKGVRSVSKGDDTSSDWKVKVGPSTRGWKATVVEQVPDERIVWHSDGAKGTTRGSVSFHELTPTLTRIVLVVEYYPSGLFEKTGNIWRAQGRRLRLDFKHFHRYVTLTNEEPEGWRGEIRDGEVVRTHEEALEAEEAEEAEEGEEGEEYAEDEEEEPGDEDYPEDEEEGEEAEDEGEGEEDEEYAEDEEEPEDEDEPEDEEYEDEDEPEDEEYEDEDEEEYEGSRR
ncbi:SRPBCC family protein [Actinacidiphila glaucinigra]|uniref:SRPBCC family protein n=1 Tax=Actinacidiphila glaucinigra TaxID=235986 RepID=UPI0037182149